MKSTHSSFDSVKTLLMPAVAAMFSLAMTSCKSTQGSGSGEYSQYPADGGYNPYPGSGAEQYQTYQPSQPPQYQQYTPPQQPQYPSYSPPPAPEPSYAPPASSGGGSYTVKKGDTLFRIAKNNGVSVSALKNANGLTSDLIRVGQKLVIP